MPTAKAVVKSAKEGVTYMDVPHLGYTLSELRTTLPLHTLLQFTWTPAGNVNVFYD